MFLKSLFRYAKVVVVGRLGSLIGQSKEYPTSEKQNIRWSFQRMFVCSPDFTLSDWLHYGAFAWLNHNRAIAEPALYGKIIYADFHDACLFQRFYCFFSISQIVLLPTATTPSFSIFDAVTELTSTDTFIISSANRSLFFAFGLRHSYDSANVVLGQSVH